MRPDYLLMGVPSWLVRELADSVEQIEEKQPVDHDGDDVYGRVVQGQQRQVSAIQQHADQKSGFASASSENSQHHENAGRQCIHCKNGAQGRAVHQSRAQAGSP